MFISVFVRFFFFYVTTELSIFSRYNFKSSARLVCVNAFLSIHRITYKNFLRIFKSSSLIYSKKWNSANIRSLLNARVGTTEVMDSKFEEQSFYLFSQADYFHLCGRLCHHKSINFKNNLLNIELHSNLKWRMWFFWWKERCAEVAVDNCRNFKIQTFSFILRPSLVSTILFIQERTFFSILMLWMHSTFNSVRLLEDRIVISVVWIRWRAIIIIIE